MSENVGAISYLVEIDTKNFTAKLKSVDGAVQSVAKSGSNHLSSFASNASSAFGGVASSIASLAKVAGATLLGGTFGGKVFVDAASQLQSLRASFESLTGSVGETNSVMGTLYKYGLQTAFKNESIQQTAKMFLANGVAVKDLMGWMQQLGDVAGATGADLTMLALPITQAIGKGKLQTQDWYQIINQGAGGLQKYIVAALGAGHSTETFQDDLANGAVTADVLRKALEMASAEGGMAFNGAIKQSETFNGRMSNLMEGITNVGLAVLGVDAVTGQVQAGGVFDNLSRSVQQATEWLSENKQRIIDVANIIITNAVPAIAGIAAAFVVAKVAAIGFGIVAGIAAGTISLPFILAAAVITAVAGAIAFVITKTVGFQPIIDGITQGIKALSDGLNWMWQQFSPIFESIAANKPLLEFLGTFFQTLAVIVGVGLVVAFGLVLGAVTVVIGIFEVLRNIGVFLGDTIYNVASFFVNAWNTIVTAWNGAANWFSGIVNGIKNFFSGIPGAIGGFFQDAWNRVTGIFGGIASWFGRIDLAQAGKDMINGLVKGIGNAKDAVVNKIKEIASGALDAIKNFFGIHSPSKVMAQMGTYMMQGWSIGMDKSSSMAISSAQRASSGVLGTFDNLTSPTLGVDGTGSLSGSYGSRTANITNNYVVNNQADAEIISRQQAYAMGAV